MSPRHDILPYGRQSIIQDDIDAVLECLRSDFLTQGPQVAAFEKALCGATGARGAVAVANGTAALHLACTALGLGPGKLGLTSAITFVASANAVRYTGARVGLIDVDPRTGLITPETTERALDDLGGDNPHVLIPVDLAGQPVALPELHTLAHAKGAHLLHDAAHSLGATYRSASQRHVVGDGAHADATILSFHPVKHITTGEGGAVLSPHDWVLQRVERLRSHGIEKAEEDWARPINDPFVGPWYYEQKELGFNYRLPDLNCALGISQLKRLAAFIERRRALAATYDQVFRTPKFADVLTPLEQRPDTESSYHLYIIRLLPRDGENATGVATRRKSLYNSLRDAGIYTQVHYIPVDWHPDFHSAWQPRGGLPGAESYYSGCLSLPLFPSMRDDDIDRVISAISSHF